MKSKISIDDISIDEVEDSYFKDDKLVIEYKKKSLFIRIIENDIVVTLIAIFGGAFALAFIIKSLLE